MLDEEDDTADAASNDWVYDRSKLQCSCLWYLLIFDERLKQINSKQ